MHLRGVVRVGVEGVAGERVGGGLTGLESSCGCGSCHCTSGRGGVGDGCWLGQSSDAGRKGGNLEDGGEHLRKCRCIRGVERDNDAAWWFYLYFIFHYGAASSKSTSYMSRLTHIVCLPWSRHLMRLKTTSVLRTVI